MRAGAGTPRGPTAAGRSRTASRGAGAGAAGCRTNSGREEAQREPGTGGTPALSAHAVLAMVAAGMAPTASRTARSIAGSTGHAPKRQAPGAGPDMKPLAVRQLETPGALRVEIRVALVQLPQSIDRVFDQPSEDFPAKQRCRGPWDEDPSDCRRRTRSRMTVPRASPGRR